MAVKQFSNRASTTLAAPITSTATSLSVVAGGGALFPSLTAGKNFTATLTSATGGNTNVEIILVTATGTDSFTTIARAQEGTTAYAWNAGDFVSLLNTAGDMGSMAQADDVQKQGGNYALDTGSANAYVAGFAPAITAHLTGTPLRVKIANANTSGTVTFNDGAGAASAYLPGGALPAVGALLAGGIATFVWDGSGFQITELPTNITGLEQTIANLLYPIGAYLMVESDTFNPNASFTWQTWTEVQGVVLVGRNPSIPQFASTGLTGGEIAHQLVPGEIPPLAYQDCFYAEDQNLIQPLPQGKYIGSVNNGIGSAATDYNNTWAAYINSTTLSGSALDGKSLASPHNNLQPYRVVRMWRRTA